MQRKTQQPREVLSKEGYVYSKNEEARASVERVRKGRVGCHLHKDAFMSLGLPRASHLPLSSTQAEPVRNWAPSQESVRERKQR